LDSTTEIGRLLLLGRVMMMMTKWDGGHRDAEELPQVAAIVDKRPREVQLLEQFQQGKWKQMESSGVVVGSEDLDGGGDGRRIRHVTTKKD
jgi:hypothetical protein